MYSKVVLLNSFRFSLIRIKKSDITTMKNTIKINDLVKIGNAFKVSDTYNKERFNYMFIFDTTYFYITNGSMLLKQKHNFNLTEPYYLKLNDKQLLKNGVLVNESEALKILFSDDVKKVFDTEFLKTSFYLSNEPYSMDIKAFKQVIPKNLKVLETKTITKAQFTELKKLKTLINKNRSKNNLLILHDKLRYWDHYSDLKEVDASFCLSYAFNLEQFIKVLSLFFVKKINEVKIQVVDYGKSHALEIETEDKYLLLMGVRSYD